WTTTGLLYWTSGSADHGVRRIDSLANPRIVRRFGYFSRAAGVFVLLLGLLVLVGWTLDIGVLKSILPGFVSMKANTALAFIFSGAALLLLPPGPAVAWRRNLALASAGAVAVLGLANLAEYLCGLDLGIDQLFFRDPQLSPVPPGRMAVTTALSFLLLGISLLFLLRNGKRNRYAVQRFCAVVVFFSFLAVVGYLYNAQSLYAFGSYSAMALHTAVVFVVLSLGVLCVRLDRGIMAVVLSDGIAGEMLRHLLPAIVVLNVGVGRLLLGGFHFDEFEDAYLIALVVSLNTVVSVYLISLSAWSQYRTEARRKQAEAARDRALADLRDSERLLNEAQEISMAGGWEVDVDTRLVKWTAETEVLQFAS
ncbi:MAG: hypothetical protein Q7O66_05665, partial [Dehalococcoidia bacterium]|nr:hypothetical protein [Dehalococcoidia bacterium]